jgi:hypothetical protein
MIEVSKADALPELDPVAVVPTKNSNRTWKATKPGSESFEEKDKLFVIRERHAGGAMLSTSSKKSLYAGRRS